MKKIFMRENDPDKNWESAPLLAPVLVETAWNRRIQFKEINLFPMTHELGSEWFSQRANEWAHLRSSLKESSISFVFTKFRFCFVARAIQIICKRMTSFCSINPNQSTNQSLKNVLLFFFLLLFFLLLFLLLLFFLLLFFLLLFTFLFFRFILYVAESSFVSLNSRPTSPNREPILATVAKRPSSSCSPKFSINCQKVAKKFA